MVTERNHQSLLNALNRIQDLPQCVEPLNVEAGEDIRILDISGREDLDLPDQDFWMFDEESVVQLTYRPDGTQIGRELLEDPTIETFIRYRDVALRNAVPLGEYQV